MAGKRTEDLSDAELDALLSGTAPTATTPAAASSARPAAGDERSLRVLVRPSGGGSKVPGLGAGSDDPTTLTDERIDALMLGTGRNAPVSVGSAKPSGGSGKSETAAGGSPGVSLDMPEGPRKLVGAYARAIVNGVPIAGPYIQDLGERAGAGINSLVHGTSYDDELARNRTVSNKLIGDNPAYANQVGGVTGSVLGTLPLAATGPGSFALGLAGSLPVRAAAGAVGNALIGGTDAYVRGEDVERGALMGGLAGGGAPIAGRAIGMAAATPVGQAVLAPVNKLIDMARNQFSGTARAGNSLMEAMSASEQSVAALRAELRRNPNLALADLDPAFRERLVGLAQGGPEAPAISKWVAGRRDAAPRQVREGIEGSIGAAPDPVALRESLATTARDNARKGFGDALQNAQPIDLSNLPQASVQRIQEAWSRAVAAFPDRSAQRFTQAEALHLAQQQLRREADTLAKSATGSDRLAAQDVRNVRDQLVTRLDQATGGRFRPAQAKYADDMAVREAFDNGMSALDRVRNGAAGLEARPEALRRDWQAMSHPEREAYREGVRTQIQTTMENARNPARAGEAVTDPDFNRQKLAIIFGDDEAGRLMRAVEDTRRIAETNNRAIGGSDTAQRTAARESVAVRAGKGAAEIGIHGLAGIVGGPSGAAASLSLRGASMANNALARRADLARNRLLANDLMAAGPQGEAALNNLSQFMAERAAPTWLGRAANDPSVNLLIQGVSRRSSSRQ